MSKQQEIHSSNDNSSLIRSHKRLIFNIFVFNHLIKIFVIKHK